MACAQSTAASPRSPNTTVKVRNLQTDFGGIEYMATSRSAYLAVIGTLRSLISEVDITRTGGCQGKFGPRCFILWNGRPQPIPPSGEAKNRVPEKSHHRRP